MRNSSIPDGVTDSPSFRSGHAASAVASAAGQAAPGVWLPLHAAAATVAFSRVHTGVHYTSDVAARAMGRLRACGETRR